MSSASLTDAGTGLNYDPYGLPAPSQNGLDKPLNMGANSKKWEWDALEGFVNKAQDAQDARQISSRKSAVKRKVLKGYSGSLNAAVQAELQAETRAKQEIAANEKKGGVNALSQGKDMVRNVISPTLSAAMSARDLAREKLGMAPVLTKNKIPDRRSAVDRTASKPRHWNADEDNLLREAVAHYGNKHWKKIAARVPGRNHTQCLQRWSKVLAPGLKKGQWAEIEDATLIKTAQEQLDACLRDGKPKKLNWGQICKKIPGRTAKQCRERWVNNLNPEIRKGQWTPEEDQRILELHQLFPKKWAMISKHLQGRTENSVKIRFKTLARGGVVGNAKAVTEKRVASVRVAAGSQKPDNSLPPLLPVTLNTKSAVPETGPNQIAYAHGATLYEQARTKLEHPNRASNNYQSSRSIHHSFNTSQSKLYPGDCRKLTQESDNLDLLMNSLIAHTFDDRHENPGNSSEFNTSQQYLDSMQYMPVNYGSNSKLSGSSQGRGIEQKMTNLWQASSGDVFGSGRKIEGGSNSSLKFPVGGGSGRKLSDLLLGGSTRSNSGNVPIAIGSARNLSGFSSNGSKRNNGGNVDFELQDLIDLPDGDFDSLYVQAPS
uniref:Uncharacterized protein n=1 Tax=Aplanochytrium stocchinoi TaxID=215587 RepID=A0A7S3PRD7_9STRA|mmetsp:Transcript_12163/g.15827  ORF Transcript_12163/g.15827 Transcript_12163/m.15827 type:complete len:602 (+) Transcript_12163:440-2245(+)